MNCAVRTLRSPRSRSVLHTFAWIAVAALASLPACGGDEFASAPGTGGQAGQGGHDGGVDAQGGADAQGGTGGHVDAAVDHKEAAAFEVGPPKDATPDHASAGSAGAPIVDAAQEPAPVACTGTGFWTQPASPKTPLFDVFYKNTGGLVCVRFEVQCSNGPGILSNIDMSSINCPSPNFCWGNHVAACAEGQATVRFLKDADDHGTNTTCNNLFAGSEGKEVASCTFAVGK